MPAFTPTIAVDAMGGDQAPRTEVEGAVLAASELGVPVALVGPEEILRKELRLHDTRRLPIEVVHASEAISMDERAARAVRQKRDSSIRAATRLVRDGRAAGVVSAGNTGAVMATAKIVLGTLPSVDRPGLAALFPSIGGANHGRGAILIDVGANVDCKPEQLRQFAVMGATYSRLLLNIASPRVGLLSIGSEQSKGNELTRQAHQLLEHSPLNFIGNVEGRDLYNGAADVVVCDGFTGNVALKISEGLADAVKAFLRKNFLSGAGEKPRDAAVSQVFENISREIDYVEAGGALLLGVKGVCTICHGSSGPRAIKNAIRLTSAFAASGLNEKMESELHKLSLPAASGRPAVRKQAR
jgi:phosphate acyltransferase